jgi:hypothetical protein
MMCSILEEALELFANITPGRKGFSRDKHSSLRLYFVGDEKNFLLTLTPVANVIKLFTAVKYDFIKS